MQCLCNILKHANFHQMDRNDYHVFLVYINNCLWNLSLTWDFIVGNQAPFAEFPKCVINIYARFFQNASCKLVDMNDLVDRISFIFVKKGIWITTMLYFIYIFMGVIKLRYIQFDSCADDKQYQPPSPQSIKRIIDKLMVWT